MEREQLVKIVDEVAEGLMEGGPGSGRYPEGSGKHPKDVSIEAANLSAIALKTTNDDLDAREKAHTAAGDAHEKAAQHIRDEIAAKRLAADEELKARTHSMRAGFHRDVVKDTKKARKAEENVAAGRKTPEERTRRITTYHIKNTIRFLARQRRDNNSD